MTARIVIVGVRDAAMPDRLTAALAARGVDCRVSAMNGAAVLGAAEAEVLCAADAVILATSTTAGLSDAVRRTALAAARLGVALPSLAVAFDGTREDEARLAAITHAWAEHARMIGIRHAVTLAWPDNIDLLTDALLGRLADSAMARAPLRLWVEAAESTAAGTRVTGTIAGGTATVGQSIVAMPSAESARIVSLETVGEGRMRVVLDRAIAVGDGHMLASAEARPELADQVAAELIWTGAKPLLPGRSYRFQLGPQRLDMQVSTLKHKLDPDSFEHIAARRLSAGEVGVVNLSFGEPIVFDTRESALATSGFLVRETAGDTIVGLGRIQFTLRRATNIHWQSLAVDKGARARLKGQAPCCLWFTGLSGSGKSTVASLLEKRLNALGRHTYTLDGDNVRHGLNRDLGFTEVDRVENIRRVAEVSRLFVDAGLIVLVSFISPFRAERRLARSLMGEGEFIEVFVDTPLEVCEARDSKGLYKKARAGQLKNFTGIDSPYEPPEKAEIHLDAGHSPPEELVDTIMDELARRAVVMK